MTQLLSTRLYSFSIFRLIASFIFLLSLSACNIDIGDDPEDDTTHNPPKPNIPPPPSAKFTSTPKIKGIYDKLSSTSQKHLDDFFDKQGKVIEKLKKDLQLPIGDIVDPNTSISTEKGNSMIFSFTKLNNDIGGLYNKLSEINSDDQKKELQASLLIPYAKEFIIPLAKKFKREGIAARYGGNLYHYDKLRNAKTDDEIYNIFLNNEVSV